MIMYSSNNEEFNYDEIDDAILDVCDGGEAVVGDIITVYEGEGVKRKASYYVKNLIDAMSDAAYDDCGEYCENWPFDSCSQLQGLVDAVVDKWADDNKQQPTFYNVVKVEEIQVKIISMDGDYEIVK